jgi:hypothetical protein
MLYFEYGILLSWLIASFNKISVISWRSFSCGVNHKIIDLGNVTDKCDYIKFCPVQHCGDENRTHHYSGDRHWYHMVVPYTLVVQFLTLPLLNEAPVPSQGSKHYYIWMLEGYIWLFYDFSVGFWPVPTVFIYLFFLLYFQ